VHARPSTCPQPTRTTTGTRRDWSCPGSRWSAAQRKGGITFLALTRVVQTYAKQRDSNPARAAAGLLVSRRLQLAMKQAEADRATIEDSQSSIVYVTQRAQQRVSSLETALKASEAARKIAEESIIACEESGASALASMQAEMFLEKQVGSRGCGCASFHRRCMRPLPRES
jgi:hypothetical protein